MEELKNILISDEVLDQLGFSEYWDNDGDSGDRAIQMNKRYAIVVVDEVKEDTDYGMGGIVKAHPQNYHSRQTYNDLVTLHDFWSELDEEDKNNFRVLCQQKLQQVT